jgi:hypothetical protein
MVYVARATTGVTIASEERLKKGIDHTPERLSCEQVSGVMRSGLVLTMHTVVGRKDMLTYVRILIFFPSCVDARLLITGLALKSYSRMLAT